MQLRSIPTAFKRRAAAFHRDDQGAIAIMFGLMLVVFVLLLGGVLDFGSALVARSRLGHSTDSAALAIAVSPKVMSDSEREAVAQRYFEANYQTTAGVTVGFPDLDVRQHCDGANLICVKSTAEMQTAMLGAAGSVERIPVGVETNVVSASAEPDVDTVAIIDASGSMRNDVYDQGTSAPNRKIDFLQTAAKDLVDIIQTPEYQNVRIGFAVYSTTLVETHALDASATNNKDYIDNLDTYNFTCGECGLVGGLDVLNSIAGSPRNDGASYSAVKQIIFMTDGIQNKTYADPNGPTDEAAGIAAFTARCDQIHNDLPGVRIFTIGFGNQAADPTTPNATAMKNCATDDGSGGKLFFPAPDNATLQAVFQDIARRIKAVRITK